MNTLKQLKQQYQAWYQRLEKKSLAKLPPHERQDILAFDAKLKLHWPRYVALMLAIWISAAFLIRLYDDRVSWMAALVITLLLIGGIGVAFLSAWFGHSKFKVSAKLLIILILCTLCGAIAGGLVGSFLKGGTSAIMADVIRIGPKILISGIIAGVVYCGLVLIVVFARRKQLQVRNTLLEQQAKDDRLARQLADAKLKLMQAQVEPHFLFNTLASVQHLAEARAPEAAALTRDLIIFLRAGLGGLRDETTTLQREFEMAAAYLAIMQTRMGERLRYTLELPDTLTNKSVPPAMLISLVENAIKHGVEPATDGGTIHLFAIETNGALQLGVRDTGLGLRQQTTLDNSACGIGLANVRERLLAIFGDTATLTIEENSPRGVTATITIKDSNKEEITV